MNVHELKTWPEDFVAVVEGTKTHEARKADRPFSVGDVLRLREWIPENPDSCDWRSSHQSAPTPGVEDWAEKMDLIVRNSGKYTGRAIDMHITHITIGQYGLPKNLAIMSIAPRGLPYNFA